MIPVKPPTVNKNKKPTTHKIVDITGQVIPYNVAIHEKILIPVGTAITIVAEVK